MATEIDRTGANERSALARRRSALRFNWSAARALAARRRDLRFMVVPYDPLRVVNAAAVVISLLLLAVVMLDPYLTAWQRSLPEELVAFFKLVTRFGKSDWILIGCATALLLCILLDATALRRRRQARRAVRAAAAFYVFVAVALSGIIVNLAKRIIGRARPRHFDETGSLSFDFWTGDSSWASFPSGHATTAMAFGVALALLFPRLRWIFLCLGFWIAASRMFVSAHYPSDVLAGGLLGGVTAWLIARMLAQRRIVFGFSESGGLIRRRGASGRLF